MILLHQNEPNPFEEQTTIQYHIPYDFRRAQLVIGSIDGSVVKIVNIKEKGTGKLTLFKDEIIQGYYSYTLIIDGVKVSTKKMMKQ